jgi:ubiquinone biosynthesis protein UbiJ
MAPATKNFHLPLPQALYDELRAAAREVDQPATKLAQELMRTGLDEWRRVRRRQQIAAYARQVAGTRDDLDPELEAAGISSLVAKR